MKYLVMECHLSYAVVLDEDGRFLKVANRNYEVGQKVTEVIEMQVPQPVPQKKKQNKWISSMAAMAACLVLMVTAMLQGSHPYASVYMTINPEVRIDVNRRDMVVGIDGVNTDGEDLIQGYDYKKKDLDLVMDDLIDRAMDMGYLHEGGRISLVLDADSEDWVIAHSDSLSDHISSHLSEKITVSVEVTRPHTPTPRPNRVVIPVGPTSDDDDEGDSDYGNSDYGDSNYGDSDYGTPPHADSDYEDAMSDYLQDDTDSDYAEDSASDYDSSYDDVEDGETDYGNVTDDSDYEADTADDSSYDQSDYHEDDEESEDDNSDYDES